MNKIKLLISIILLVFFQYNAIFAQKTVSGKIIDSETKQAIGFVNISIKGTNLGTLSNPEGGFVISVNQSTITLVCSHISYEIQEVLIKENEQNIQIALKPAAIVLNPVTITDSYAQELITKTGSVNY